jgi:hypothetical protein
MMRGGIMKQNFIKTTDLETAEKLTLLGFKLVSCDGCTYTFLNQPPKNFNFENIDIKKLAYTNMLSF